MNKIKLELLSQEGEIYYTDTGSIVTGIELTEHLVENLLGQFKLLSRGAQAPGLNNNIFWLKTYCLVMEKGETKMKAKKVFQKEACFATHSFNKKRYQYFCYFMILITAHPQKGRRVKLFDDKRDASSELTLNRSLLVRRDGQLNFIIYKLLFIVRVLCLLANLIRFLKRFN